MATFTWTPSYAPQAEVTPRVRSARFGDGYEQRVVDGLNAQLRAFDLAFNLRTATEVDEIEAFLAARAGAEAFDWTPPFGAAGKWLCRSWRRRREAPDWHYIDARFEETPA